MKVYWEVEKEKGRFNFGENEIFNKIGEKEKFDEAKKTGNPVKLFSYLREYCGKYADYSISVYAMPEMKICKNNHEEVIFAEDLCPKCLL